MRHLVCSDIHLNINRRFEDILSAMEQIYQIALTNKVDKILILGDSYTSRRPHSEERTAFESWIQKFRDAHIPVVILIGNHDCYPSGVNSFSEFDHLKVDGVSVHESPWVEEGIFMGHMLLREAKIGPTDYQLMEAMTTDELVARYPGCRAYVLGDVHAAQVLRLKPFVAYAGSIEHVDFGERDDIKSVMILDDGGLAITWGCIPIKTRPMLQYDITLPTDSKPIVPTDCADAIVKIVYHGTADEIKQIDEAGIRKLLGAFAKELTIQYDVIKENRARDKEVNENLTPSVALSKYLNKLNLSVEEYQKVLDLGNGVINAET